MSTSWNVIWTSSNVIRTSSNVITLASLALIFLFLNHIDVTHAGPRTRDQISYEVVEITFYEVDIEILLAEQRILFLLLGFIFSNKIVVRKG